MDALQSIPSGLPLSTHVGHIGKAATSLGRQAFGFQRQQDFPSLSSSQSSQVPVAGLAAVASVTTAAALGRRNGRRNGWLWSRGRDVAVHRAADRVPAKRDEGGVQVADKTDQSLDYVPSRDEAQQEEIELMEATGALKLQRKEEAYQARKKWRQKNPSPMDKWEDDMEAVRMDTERRKLWGDLRWKSGKGRRFRGKRILEKETEIKMNRGFPVEDTEEDDLADQQQDKEWLNMWRACWPAQESIDPHDPESFGFGLVGEITGAHGVWGDVRIRADDMLCDQGYEPEKALQRRNFSNWTEPSKRIHIKAPHRRFPRPFRIITGRRVQRRVFACRLAGIDSVEDAMSMRGHKVYILEPPPGVDPAKDSKDAPPVDYYDADTTHFALHDALELIGAKCVMLNGKLSDEAAVDFAMADTPDAAKGVLEWHNIPSTEFGEMTGVVPDFTVAPRFRAKMAAHSLLDITLKEEINGGEGKYLYEEDPDSPLGKFLNKPAPPAGYERVTYVPFVPDMIARVDADRMAKTVYFTLPDGHLEATAFTCRKRIINEQGLLAIPRAPMVKALLAPPGRSHAIRRRDGKSRPLHGTAPAAPPDMLHPAGMAHPEMPAGVATPEYYRETAPFQKHPFKKSNQNFHEKMRAVTPQLDPYIPSDDYVRPSDPEEPSEPSQLPPEQERRPSSPTQR